MGIIEVRPADAADTGFIRTTLQESWGGTLVVAHGELLDAAAQPALIAWRSGERVGLLTYRAEAGESAWEVVSLDATVPGIGAGSALLAAVRARARDQGIRRVWLVTTNDNIHALGFYQRRGFDLVALNRDAITAARKLKPTIPASVGGIALRHELVLEVTP